MNFKISSLTNSLDILTLFAIGPICTLTNVITCLVIYKYMYKTSQLKYIITMLNAVHTVALIFSIIAYFLAKYQSSTRMCIFSTFTAGIFLIWSNFCIGWASYVRFLEVNQKNARLSNLSIIILVVFLSILISSPKLIRPYLTNYLVTTWSVNNTTNEQFLLEFRVECSSYNYVDLFIFDSIDFTTSLCSLGVFILLTKLIATRLIETKNRLLASSMRICERTGCGEARKREIRYGKIIFSANFLSFSLIFFNQLVRFLKHIFILNGILVAQMDIILFLEALSFSFKMINYNLYFIIYASINPVFRQKLIKIFKHS